MNVSRQSKSLARYLGLNRNVGVLAVSTFGLGLGEELWQAYLPAYLVALGASGFVVGLFASLKDLLDGLYQYPGGWVNDHYGRKRALLVFTSIALAGYVVNAVAFHWGFLFLGLVLVMAWKAGSFPATFAIIGHSLARGKRGIAFSVQSVLVRLPRMVAAPLGGLLIAAFGIVGGIRIAFAATILLAVAVIFTQRKAFRADSSVKEDSAPLSAVKIFQAMPISMKRLLAAECLVRTGEAIAGSFIVLYVLEVLHYSPSTYGLLYALQQGVAIVSYIPAGKLADRTGRRPLIALTFLFFALFPFAVQQAQSFLWLSGAFIVGGLKEFGEPARKSLILDLSDENRTGRTVGAYYAIRNLLIVPAGAIGGILWQLGPEFPLQIACVVSTLGLLGYLVSKPGGGHERPR